tara:strand:+ start:625 stop:810 length:186 start_codon:yes stop_codon:yes gene_type:complete
MNWKYHRSHTNVYRINDTHTNIQGYSIHSMKWLTLLHSREQVDRVLNLEEIEEEDVFLEMI